MTDQAQKLTKECLKTKSTYLDLGNCGITDLNELPELFACTHLQTLILCNEWDEWEQGEFVINKSVNSGPPNWLSSVPPDIGKLTALITLVCGGTGYIKWAISDISFLQGLTGLQTLDLRHNQIQDLILPQGLDSLQKLDLSCNQIHDVSLPEDLKSLQTLNLSDNQIREISLPHGLENLQTLDLSYNQIWKIPIPESLKNLQTLDLSENQLWYIVSIPKGLYSLQKLDLSCNQIHDVSLPEDLKSLQTLNLRRNKIGDISLPKGLKSLQTLNLNYNHIRNISLPEGLKSLQMLNLSMNFIRDISSLQGLKDLLILHLDRNEITEVSLEFLNTFPSLADLRIGLNPISNIHREVYDKFENVLEDVRNYLEAKALGSVVNNEVKALLIGNGSVGKTQVALKLSEKDSFQFNTEHNSTHGINLLSCQMNSDLFEEGLKITLWDVGGQDIYHTTHRLFMQTNALFLLVWDRENEVNNYHEWQGKKYKNEKLTYWLEYASCFGKGSPILVLQNKIDLPDQREIPLPEQKNFRKRYPIKGFLRVSAAKEKGFRVLENRIRKAFEEDEELLKELPSSWVELRKKVRSEQARKDSPKRISRETFQQWYKEYGEDESSETVLRFFHETGVLYYQPDYFLGNIILDQAWAIKAVYQVLDRESDYFEVMEANEGHFSYDDICQVWPEYSDHERALFIDFMLSAKTCFETTLDQRRDTKLDDRTFIIPQFLPASRPAYLKNYINQHEISEVDKIAYRFLPSLFIQRYIVKAKDLAEDMWQSGIYLQKDGQHAIVEADYEARKILISYNPYSKKLLQSIKNELDAINQNTIAKALKGKPDILDEYLREGFEDLLHKRIPVINREESNKKDLKVFVSYAHKDKDYFKVFTEELGEHLNNSLRYSFDTFDDRQILVGSDWNARLEKEVKECNVGILLCSAAFFNREYIKERELAPLLKKLKNKDKFLLVPIFLRSFNFEEFTFIKPYQFFKSDGETYGHADKKDNLCFSHLIKFDTQNGKNIATPNAYRDDYLKDLAKKIIEALDKKFKPL